MKSRSKSSSNKKLIERRRKIRGRLPADSILPQAIRKVRVSPRKFPTWRGRRTNSLMVPGVDPLSNRSMLDAADGFERPADTPGKKKGGVSKARRRAPPAGLPQPSWPAKSRYVTAADVLADLPPPEIARKLRVKDVRNEARRKTVDVESTVANWNRFAAEHGSFVDGLSYSDHGLHDVLSVVLNTLAARTILDNPLLIETARNTLERWISRQMQALQALLEWRDILAGTPQQIAAVAMSLTEEATRLRSSSPLGTVLTPRERSAIFGVFGKTTPEGTGARAEALGAFVVDWEQEHGAFTAGELRAAAASTESPKPRASSAARRTMKSKAFARILAQAIKTFGSKDNAEAWLNSPAISLGMKRPIDLLVTTEGAQQVETILGRIESGTYT